MYCCMSSSSTSPTPYHCFSVIHKNCKELPDAVWLNEMFKLRSLNLVLNANAADNWRTFLMQIEIYLVTKGKDSKLDKLKVHVNLLLCWLRIQSFVYNEGEDKECFADICNKFKELCEGARNVIYERCNCRF